MDDIKEFLMNAEIAFSSKQYNEALDWFHKVLKITPDDLYALSRAGAICVSLGLFDEALEHFRRARELDPQNGDNAFNYGNACFFNHDNVKAFGAYVEAEKLGCSGDVTPRLYYQLALICSMRQDYDSALIYFQKCEEADPEGMISLSPDMISEKLKLYMIQQKYQDAEKCAAQLVAIQPRVFKNYMVQFSLLMAQQDYQGSEKILSDANKYAELSDDDRFTLTLELSALYTSRADHSPENERAYYLTQALEVLKKEVVEQGTESDLKLQISMAEVYMKMGKADEAINILRGLLPGEPVAAAPIQTDVTTAYEEIPYDELEAMLENDVEQIQTQIDIGAMDDDMGSYAQSDYDAMGNEVHYYDDGMFRNPQEPAQPEEPNRDDAVPEYSAYKLTPEYRERIVFMLLSCHLEKNEFAAAHRLAKILKNSENKYYSYYGRYTEAMTQRKMEGASEASERKYAEEIAYFRNKTFSDATDVLAAIFRARLYAEQGKYAKAEEIAHLLSDEDQKAITNYIEECKNQ